MWFRCCPQTTSSSNEITVEQIHAIISRVLCVSWKEPTEKTIFLPETSSTCKSYKVEDFGDIVSQALMEVLYMFARGDDPLKEMAINTPSDREDSPHSEASPLLSPVAAVGPSSSTSWINLPSCSKPQPKSFDYLMDCYSRVAVEERNHPKVR